MHFTSNPNRRQTLFRWAGGHFSNAPFRARPIDGPRKAGEANRWNPAYGPDHQVVPDHQVAPNLGPAYAPEKARGSGDLKSDGEARRPSPVGFRRI